MASLSRNPTVKSLSPRIIQKIEQEIINEAKSEEQFLKAAVKDLHWHNTEKDEHKANKATARAERLLEKAEKSEQSTQVKDLYRAQNAHDVALNNVNQAQHSFELSVRHHAKTQESLQKKSSRVDEAIKLNDEHPKSRNARLTALRGPSAKDEAGRVIPDTTVNSA